jgi:AcrR family transcriptional regulator
LSCFVGVGAGAQAQASVGLAGSSKDLLLSTSLNERLVNEEERVARSRQEQSEWRRERLLDAALEVFAAKGIAAASMKEVAAAAGVTPGLIYHYFESKDVLATAVLAERGFLPQLRALLAGAEDRPAVEVLPELLRDFDNLLAANAQLVSLFFAAGQTNEEARHALQGLVTEGQALLATYLDSRIAAGELRPHDSSTAAATLFATVALSRRIGKPLDPAELVDVLLVGLLARTERRDA